MKKHFLITLVLLFSIQILSAQEDWETFEGNDYSISFPQEWNFDKSGQMGTTLIVFSPLEDDDEFSENVNLIIQDISAYNLDLEAYTKISIDQIKQMIVGGELLSSETITSGNSTFQKVIYTGDVSGRDLKFEQYYILQNKKAYVITLTCQIDKFESYKLTGERILNSFKVLTN